MIKYNEITELLDIRILASNFILYTKSIKLLSTLPTICSISTGIELTLQCVCTGHYI